MWVFTTYGPFIAVMGLVLIVLTYALIERNDFMSAFVATCNIEQGEVLRCTETLFSYDYSVLLQSGKKVLCVCDKDWHKHVGDSVHVCISKHNVYLLEEVLDVSGCREVLADRDLISANI